MTFIYAFKKTSLVVLNVPFLIISVIVLANSTSKLVPTVLLAYPGPHASRWAPITI